MIRKRVLGIGSTSTTLLVQDTDAGKELRVLRRISVSGWSTEEIEQAHEAYDTLLRLQLPYFVRLYSVVLQNSFLSLLTAYCSKGDLQTHMNSAMDTAFPTTLVLQWLLVLAHAIHNLHNQAHQCYYGISLSRVYRSNSQGTAGIVLGIPLLAFSYFRGLQDKRESGAVVEMDYPPEVLQHNSYHPFLSDVWHLGQLGRRLLSVNVQYTQQRSSEVRDLIARMTAADLRQRIAISHVIHTLESFLGNSVDSLTSWNSLTVTPTAHQLSVQAGGRNANSPAHRTHHPNRLPSPTSMNKSALSPCVSNISHNEHAPVRRSGDSHSIGPLQIETAAAAPVTRRTEENCDVPTMPKEGAATAYTAPATASNFLSHADADSLRTSPLRIASGHRTPERSSHSARSTNRSAAGGVRHAAGAYRRGSWQKRTMEQLEELQRWNASPISTSVPSQCASQPQKAAATSARSQRPELNSSDGTYVHGGTSAADATADKIGSDVKNSNVNRDNSNDTYFNDCNIASSAVRKPTTSSYTVEGALSPAVHSSMQTGSSSTSTASASSPSQPTTTTRTAGDTYATPIKAQVRTRDTRIENCTPSRATGANAREANRKGVAAAASNNTAFLSSSPLAHTAPPLTPPGITRSTREIMQSILAKRQQNLARQDEAELRQRQREQRAGAGSVADIQSDSKAAIREDASHSRQEDIRRSIEDWKKLNENKARPAESSNGVFVLVSTRPRVTAAVATSSTSTSISAAPIESNRDSALTASDDAADTKDSCSTDCNDDNAKHVDEDEEQEEGHHTSTKQSSNNSNHGEQGMTRKSTHTDRTTRRSLGDVARTSCVLSARVRAAATHQDPARLSTTVPVADSATAKPTVWSGTPKNGPAATKSQDSAMKEGHVKKRARLSSKGNKSSHSTHNTNSPTLDSDASSQVNVTVPAAALHVDSGVDNDSALSDSCVAMQSAESMNSGSLSSDGAVPQKDHVYMSKHPEDGKHVMNDTKSEVQSHQANSSSMHARSSTVAGASPIVPLPGSTDSNSTTKTKRPTSNRSHSLDGDFASGSGDRSSSKNSTKTSMNTGCNSTHGEALSSKQTITCKGISLKPLHQPAALPVHSPPPQPIPATPHRADKRMGNEGAPPPTTHSAPPAAATTPSAEAAGAGQVELTTQAARSVQHLGSNEHDDQPYHRHHNGRPAENMNSPTRPNTNTTTHGFHESILAHTNAARQSVVSHTHRSPLPESSAESSSSPSSLAVVAKLTDAVTASATRTTAEHCASRAAPPRPQLNHTSLLDTNSPAYVTNSLASASSLSTQPATTPVRIIAHSPHTRSNINTSTAVFSLASPRNPGASGDAESTGAAPIARRAGSIVDSDPQANAHPICSVTAAAAAAPVRRKMSAVTTLQVGPLMDTITEGETQAGRRSSHGQRGLGLPKPAMANDTLTPSSAAPQPINNTFAMLLEWHIDGVRSAVRALCVNRALYTDTMSVVKSFVGMTEEERMLPQHNVEFGRHLRKVIRDDRLFSATMPLCAQLVALEGFREVAREALKM